MTKRYEAILVLGCGIDDKGELGVDGRSSVQIAAKLFGRKVAPLLVFAGNFSYKASFTPPIGEAQAMKDYAVELGVPTNKIFVEAGSKDTLGNVYFSKVNLLIPLGLHHIGVLRGPNHSEKRLQFIFSKVLGPDYKYDFIKRPEIRPYEQEREDKSLKVLQSWLADVKDGDDAGVYAVLREKHPAYSSDPEAMEKLRPLSSEV